MHIYISFYVNLVLNTYMLFIEFSFLKKPFTNMYSFFVYCQKLNFVGDWVKFGVREVVFRWGCTPIGCPVPNHQHLKHTYNNIIWSQQVKSRNLYVFTYVCVHAITTHRDALNLKVSKERVVCVCVVVGREESEGKYCN